MLDNMRSAYTPKSNPSCRISYEMALYPIPSANALFLIIANKSLRICFFMLKIKRIQDSKHEFSPSVVEVVQLYTEVKHNRKAICAYFRFTYNDIMPSRSLSNPRSHGISRTFVSSAPPSSNYLNQNIVCSLYGRLYFCAHHFCPK